MRNIVKKIIRISLMISAFSFVIESKAEAQTCLTRPSCESLGYNYNASQCPEVGKRLSCPFNANAYWCNVSVSTCADGGYVDACGGKGTQVSYNGRICYKNCTEMAPILYSDKTVAKGIIYTKTPIGVVFDADKKLAIALKTSPTRLAWSEEEILIPTFEYCTNRDNRKKFFCATSGKENTAKMIAYGKEKNIAFPAAEYCHNYTTAGTKAGDWYLPSIAEFSSIAIQSEYVEKTLKVLNKAEIIGHTFQSSDVFGNDGKDFIAIAGGVSWYDPDEGMISARQGYAPLDYKHLVLPIIAF